MLRGGPGTRAPRLRLRHPFRRRCFHRCIEHPCESPDLRALRLRHRVQELREIDRGRYRIGQAKQVREGDRPDDVWPDGGGAAIRALWPVQARHVPDTSLKARHFSEGADQRYETGPAPSCVPFSQHGASTLPWIDAWTRGNSLAALGGELL